MSTKNDGGPAFPSAPVIGPNGDWLRPVDIGCEGMTLRDYFAAKAMPELVRAYCKQAEDNGYDYQWQRGIAGDAYIMADAMLAAREAR